ncbi:MULTISPECIES: four helix bundle protein [Alcanivoracaceae]|uniref:bAvd-like domain-containing protein n=1 Tax=Alcanivorax xiamenensis TaxID=1177156 RepID=A0ABQ6Y6C4_9GAMM|nr:four helix bundle protein [Alcanivorax xiamenensis]KAF0804894.1 hypothetical protein A6D6_02658 [Alcanivorax xiamenensis]
MALHSELPIYRLSYELLSVATEVTRNIPRDYKRLFGEKVRDECVEILVLIFRANTARNKVPHIEDLLERLQVVELLLRLCRDKRFISTKQYAAAVEITDKVGRQATGWKRHSAAASPAV